MAYVYINIYDWFRCGIICKVIYEFLYTEYWFDAARRLIRNICICNLSRVFELNNKNVATIKALFITHIDTLFEWIYTIACYYYSNDESCIKN